MLNIFKRNKESSNVFLNTGKKLTGNEIKEIEEMLQISIPKQLTEHYLKYNGGTPKDNFLYSEISDIEISIQSFLPMKYKDEIGFTVESMYANFVNKKVIPAQYLPFAIDYGCNLFCMDLNTNEIVIIWMDQGEVTENEIHVLSESFDAFLAALEQPEC